GHKVPAIVWWPGRIKAGALSNEPLISIDVMPTLLDLAGASCDVKLDGVSFSDVILSGKSLPKRPLYWASLSNGGHRSEAVRQDAWKLVVLHPQAAPGTFENPRKELYNLAADPGETTNVADQHPARVASMLKQLRSWFAETQATATKQPGGWLSKQ
ncbi:MAG: sulfatase/phosphatase domain-containing protein, partial [Planctomycetota bacterium]